MSASPNKALVVCAHGETWVLTYEVDEPIDTFIRDCGGSDGGFDPRAASLAYAYPGDGLFVGDVCIVDDGPGDLPHTREYMVQISALRPATAGEFEAFRCGEYIWREAAS